MPFRLTPRRAAAFSSVIGAVWLACGHAHGGLSAMRQKLVPTSMQQCRQLLRRTPQLDPYAPATASARDSYCGCVAKAYVAGMPDPVVLSFATGKLPDAPAEQAARMKAAAASLQAARAGCASRD